MWVFGLVSVVATLLGLTLEEDGHNAWHTVHAWGALALLGAVLSMIPAVARSWNISAQRAWQIAAGGVAAFVLFWALLVLPSVGSNTSLLTTVGLGAALISVWLAPGRDLPGVDGQAGAPPGTHSW